MMGGHAGSDALDPDVDAYQRARVCSDVTPSPLALPLGTLPPRDAIKHRAQLLLRKRDGVPPVPLLEAAPACRLPVVVRQAPEDAPDDRGSGAVALSFGHAGEPRAPFSPPRP